MANKPTGEQWYTTECENKHGECCCAIKLVIEAIKEGGRYNSKQAKLLDEALRICRYDKMFTGMY